jgi:sugar phosphate isomerase/epimerase
VQPIQVGIQLSALRQPVRKALHTAAQLGADAVEIDAQTELRPADLTRTAVRELRNLLDHLDLRVAAVRFHTRHGYDVPEQLERRIDATRQAMRMAYQLGAPVVVNQVGTVPSSEQAESWGLLVQVLSDLGRFGEHTGALLAAETGTESGMDLRRLLRALSTGFVGADLNPGNLILNGFSARDAVEQLGPYIMHVHARDAVRDTARQQAYEVTLGRGEADIPELLGRLEEHSYRGCITVTRLQSDDPVREIGRAVKYLKSFS